MAVTTRQRWHVQRNKADDFADVRVYTVRAVGQPAHQSLDVWVSHTSTRCTQCSSILCAMSASCPHARAVKQFMKRKGERHGKY